MMTDGLPLAAACTLFFIDVGLLAKPFNAALRTMNWLDNKNSSGDEIANVNFLRRYGTYVLKNTKKENLLRLTN